MSKGIDWDADTLKNARKLKQESIEISKDISKKVANVIAEELSKHPLGTIKAVETSLYQVLSVTMAEMWMSTFGNIYKMASMEEDSEVRKYVQELAKQEQVKMTSKYMSSISDVCKRGLEECH